MSVQALSSPSKPYFDYIVTMVSSGECQRYTRAVIQIPPRLSSVSYNVHLRVQFFSELVLFSLFIRKIMNALTMYILSIFLLIINLATYRNTAKPYIQKKKNWWICSKKIYSVTWAWSFFTSKVFKAVRGPKNSMFSSSTMPHLQF